MKPEGSLPSLHILIHFNPVILCLRKAGFNINIHFPTRSFNRKFTSLMLKETSIRNYLAVLRTLCPFHFLLCHYPYKIKQSTKTPLLVYEQSILRYKFSE